MTAAPRTLIVVAVEAERDSLGAEALAASGIQVLVSGIGRTNAAAATAQALAIAHERGLPFDRVLNTGVAGALPQLGGSSVSPIAAPKIGELVIASACIYAEEGIALPEGFRDMRALGFALGDFQGNALPVDPAMRDAWSHLGRIGPIATVATCSGTDAAAREVAARTQALAEAMEGAAVVHAARRMGVPALEVRAISNTTGNRPAQHWDMAAAFAALKRVGAFAAQWQ